MSHSSNSQGSSSSGNVSSAGMANPLGMIMSLFTGGGGKSASPPPQVSLPPPPTMQPIADNPAGFLPWFGQGGPGGPR